jgi:hypothetical protein
MAGVITRTAVGLPLDPMSTKAQAIAAAAATVPTPAMIRPAGAGRSRGRRPGRGVRGGLWVATTAGAATTGAAGACATGACATGNADSARAGVRFTASSRYAASR